MKNKEFVFLALICVITILPFLGLTDFHSKGEPREAVVAYSMLETGNWILPVNNGGDIAYKPPFFHWCVAAISSITGKVTEYTSRLPSALALIGMVLAGFLFYAKRRGTSLAFLMSVITLSNFEVHRAGMNCRVDMVLTAFIVLALYQLYKWCEKERQGFPWLATLFMGCATLTKGPIGILLPCLVAGVYLLVRGTKFYKAFLSMMLVAVASCLLPAIWYFAAYQQGGDNFITLVMEENFGRFMGKMTYESHENPAYYNVLTVLAGYAPYTLLVLLSLFTLKYTKLTGKPRVWWSKFTAYIRTMDDTRLFSLLSIVLIFVFYCIPKSKRSVYLLPIYPFIAYFLAEYIVYLVRIGSKAIKIYSGFLSIAGILLIATFVAVKCGFVPDSNFQGRHAAQNILYLNALEDTSIGLIGYLLILLPLFIAIFYFVRIAKTKHYASAIYCAIAMAFALFMFLDGICQPPVLNIKSDKDLAKDIREIVPEGKIYSYISIDMLRFYVVNFYNNDRVDLFERVMPEEGYLLVGARDFDMFKPRHESEYAFNEVYRSKKRGCDIRDTICLYHFAKK